MKTGSGGKGPYAFFSVKPDGSKSYIEIAAFGDVASAAGDFTEDDPISVRAHLETRKKDGEKYWSIAVVADDISRPDDRPNDEPAF